MNEIIKSKMKAKSKLYKQYIKKRKLESDFVFIESLVNEINDLVSNAKNLYYEKKNKKIKKIKQSIVVASKNLLVNS